MRENIFHEKLLLRKRTILKYVKYTPILYRIQFKEDNMSVARITTINFKSKEAADKSRTDYSANAPNEFPEAEQLIQVHVDDTTVMAISFYADEGAMERATAARTKRMGTNQDEFESVDTKIGTVTLNHRK